MFNDDGKTEFQEKNPREWTRYPFFGMASQSITQVPYHWKNHTNFFKSSFRLICFLTSNSLSSFSQVFVLLARFFSALYDFLLHLHRWHELLVHFFQRESFSIGIFILDFRADISKFFLCRIFFYFCCVYKMARLFESYVVIMERV